MSQREGMAFARTGAFATAVFARGDGNHCDGVVVVVHRPFAAAGSGVDLSLK